jgi:hypothetical protein
MGQRMSLISSMFPVSPAIIFVPLARGLLPEYGGCRSLRNQTQASVESCGRYLVVPGVWAAIRQLYRSKHFLVRYRQTIDPYRDCPGRCGARMRSVLGGSFDRDLSFFRTNLQSQLLSEFNERVV